MLNDLRSRIAVEVDGQLKTGRDVVVGALLGAEEFGFATAPLVALGCIMMRVCHLNTCPVGVATQDPRAARALHRRPGARRQLHALHRPGGPRVHGRARLPHHRRDGRAARSASRCAAPSTTGRRATSTSRRILYKPTVPRRRRPHLHDRRRTTAWSESLDATTLLRAGAGRPSSTASKVEASLPIRNTNRVVGHHDRLARSRAATAPHGLPDDTITFRFTRLGRAVLRGLHPARHDAAARGRRQRLPRQGALGRHARRSSRRADAAFVAEENVIIGNVALYGATGGEAFIRGVAGERFAVRNSGATAVVEGVGDHGCEYMTGGRVVVLGATGRNFAAGMSGGVAYVLDADGTFAVACNTEMVGPRPGRGAGGAGRAQGAPRAPRRAHRQRAGRGACWPTGRRPCPRFVKVMPHDYRRMLEAQAQLRAKGMSPEEAEMAAFEMNAHDQARVGGNLSHGQADRIPRVPARAEARPAAAGAHQGLERGPPALRRGRRCASRGRAAWTAASPSATPAS